MKIIVAIKQVPDRDSPVRIDSSGKWIDESDLQYAMNESDAHALEEALQLKEKADGEVIVLSAGPERVGTTLREALAKGADRAIHILCDDLGARDALGVARLLAEAARQENPDLLLTGLQSEDLGLGQTGVIVAELLGLPHATLILHVEKTGSGITVKRELEEGWFQDIELPLPAVLTIQSGGNKLRYATLMGIKRAKTKEIRQLAAEELVDAAAPTVALDRFTLPKKKKLTQILAGSAKESAAILVDKLETRRASYERCSGCGGTARGPHRAHRLGGSVGRDAVGQASAVTTVVLGANTEATAAEVAAKAPGRVLRVEHPLLAPYTADGFSIALEQLIRAELPDYVVFPHTYQVRDYAPALAARFGQSLIGDVVDIADGPHIRAATDAGTPEWQLSPYWPRSLLCLGAGGSIPGRACRWRPGLNRNFYAGPRSVADSHPARRALSRRGAGGRSVFRAADRKRGTRHQGRGEHPAGAGACDGAGRGAGRIAPHLRRRLAAPGAAGRQLRPDRCS